MKRQILFITLALGFVFFILSSNSGGPGAVQGVDRTGSPLSPGSCNSCHTANAFEPQILLEVQDGVGNPIATYTPGATYTVSVSVVPGTGNPVRYGFQTVALTDTDQQAGSFGTPGSGIQITTLNSIDYAEHSQPDPDGNWTIEWTAPEVGTGTVQFYAGGVAANGAGGSSGDGGTSLGSPVTLAEDVASSTRNFVLEGVEATLFPNPVRDQAQVQLMTQRPLNGLWQLMDLNGRVLEIQSVDWAAGSSFFTVPVQNLAPGRYELQIREKERFLSLPLIKI